MRRPAVRRCWLVVGLGQWRGGGGDRVTLEHFSLDLHRRIARRSNKVREDSHAPAPYRRIDIDKKDGTKHHLAIPSIIDRVAQTEVTHVLSPRLDDAEFEDSRFGYRAGRSVQQAVPSEMSQTGLEAIAPAAQEPSASVNGLPSAIPLAARQRRLEVPSLLKYHPPLSRSSGADQRAGRPSRCAGLVVLTISVARGAASFRRRFSRGSRGKG